MDPIDETINMLIETGAIELSGMNSDTNEPVYVFSPKIKDIMPELYDEHLNEVNRNIMGLWEKGFVSIDLMSPDPLVTLTDKAFDDFEIEQLSREDQVFLLETKKLLIK